jgi:hypothetical protein
MNFLVLSNLAFVAPLLLAISRGFILESVVIGLALVTSFAYHFRERTLDLAQVWEHYSPMRVLDWTTSAALVSLILYRIFHNHNIWFEVVAGVLGLLLLYVSFVSDFGYTDTGHGWWHILGAVIAFVVIYMM